MTRTEGRAFAKALWQERVIHVPGIERRPVAGAQQVRGAQDERRCG